MSAYIEVAFPTRVHISEIKGPGHPDSLADELAATLSRQYSEYTRSEFGAVLNHNFDKLAILGGQAQVEFGEGRIVRPIRVLLTGRASSAFGETTIDVGEHLRQWCLSFFESSSLQNLQLPEDLEFVDFVTGGASPGSAGRDSPRSRWFTPRDLADVRSHGSPRANDTSIGCAYYPPTPADRAAQRAIELILAMREADPGVGTDIKAVATTHDEQVASLTVAIPAIAKHTASLEIYVDRLAAIRGILGREFGTGCRLQLNARDRLSIPEVYLTATGSSVEMGDEGVVGRGNRIGGSISPLQVTSTEGFAGKNPVYHAGLIYNVVAYEIARAVSDANCGARIQCVLTSLTGAPLANPDQLVVIADRPIDRRKVDEIASQALSNCQQLTVDWLERFSSASR